MQSCLFYTLLLNKTPNFGGAETESAVASGVSDINITTEPTDVKEQTFNQEVRKLADEMARLDDIYPAYTGETININGQERTVYNSKGQRIAQSAEALQNFWRWFSDSKVVDSQGRPLVVYHGGKKGIKKFSSKFATDKDMFFFTNNKGLADEYRTLMNQI